MSHHVKFHLFLSRASGVHTSSPQSTRSSHHSMFRKRNAVRTPLKFSPPKGGNSVRKELSAAGLTRTTYSIPTQSRWTSRTNTGLGSSLKTEQSRRSIPMTMMRVVCSFSCHPKRISTNSGHLLSRVIGRLL